MKQNGIRLDQYLCDCQMVQSVERAKALVMEGQVYLNGTKADTAGTFIKENDTVTLRQKDSKYVSRGGLKLEKAFQAFPLCLTDKVCMDIGASTGGFTDCMLQNGARKVYCVDVGYGQLAWILRCDERVVNLERTNIRYLTEEKVPDKIDFFSVDVSFISLKHIFPVAAQLTNKTGTGVCLVKPQFEAERGKVGKKGVVYEAATHRDVIVRCVELAKQNNFTPCGLSFSPIKGPEGNIEFLLYVSKDAQEIPVTDTDIDAVVALAHGALDEVKNQQSAAASADTEA